jgi:hypothetical protein
VFYPIYQITCNQCLQIFLLTGYGLDDRDSIPGTTGIFLYLYHRVQTVSEAHPASYPMGTEGSYTGSKAAGA